MKKVLGILGAGPKSMALVAKTRALKHEAYQVPEIILFEKDAVAAHWSGQYGHTSGSHPLGTSPAKDLSYPYAINYSAGVNEFMLKEFSWQSFLISGISNWMNYGEWIDRGSPHPPHRVWSDYLSWVSAKLFREEQLSFVYGKVTRIVPIDGKWIVTSTTAAGEVETIVDGLVITGPGNLRQLPEQPNHPRVMDGISFWKQKSVFHDLNANQAEGPIVVVGAGETAASIISELDEQLDHGLPPAIILVNDQGIIHSRGENFFENYVYTDSDAMNWSNLSIAQRQEIINRTDRGVFSMSSLSVINQMTNLTILKGRAAGIKIDTPEDTPRLIVKTDESGNILEIPASQIIVSIGYNPWFFEEYLATELGELVAANHDQIIQTIDTDLSVDWGSLKGSLNLPKLHVPMLAGIAQGPGFPNLSCLGTLADKILKPYLDF